MVIAPALRNLLDSYLVAQPGFRSWLLSQVKSAHLSGILAYKDTINISFTDII